MTSDAQDIITSELAKCDSLHRDERARQLRAAAATYARRTVRAILDGHPRRAATYAEVFDALTESSQVGRIARALGRDGDAPGSRATIGGGVPLGDGDIRNAGTL